jgi:hypothetical protein
MLGTKEDAVEKNQGSCQSKFYFFIFGEGRRRHMQERPIGAGA